MTFAKPITNDSQEKAQKLLCSKCLMFTKYDDLVKYGSFCESCFNVYCYDVPASPPDLNKYFGDPKAWAKKIIDKHNAGENVRPITLRFAREALKMERVKSE